MLDEQPSTAWLDSLTTHSQQHLQTCSTSSLVTLVWSLALLQHRPHSDWMGACFEALSRCLAATIAAADAQQHGQQQWVGGAQHVEPLAPAQLTRVAWALAALDSHLPAAFADQLLQLCLRQAPQLDDDSLAQIVWAWERLDCTQDKRFVRQVAAVGRVHSLSGSTGRDGGVGLVLGNAVSSSSRLGSGAALQRPQPTRIRLGQQRVVLRAGGGSGRAVVVSQHHHNQPPPQQQQQQQLLVMAGGSGRDAVPAPGGGFSSSQRALFAVGSRGKLGNKQQLLATLQKIYAAELNTASGGGSSGPNSSSSSGSSTSGSDAEMTLA